MGLDPDEVAYVSLTGKASEVLRKKDNPNACTAHKLLYNFHQKKDGSYVKKAKPRLDKHYEVIVVDEVSMLPKDMWDLLLSHNVFIIASGDPFQIPPIDKSQDNHVLDHPHVFLTEVMRQAQDSEIIRLSMGIREGRFVPPYDGEQVKVIRPRDLTDGMLLWASSEEYTSQIICATRAKCKEINNRVRMLKGFDGDPQIGDKMISVSNHWNIESFDDSPLTNGTLGWIRHAYADDVHYPIKYKWFPKKVPIIRARFESEDGEDYGYLPMDKTYLETEHKFLSPQAESILLQTKSLANEVPLEFEYGYAMSVHKSQGSEWEKVLVIEEEFPYPPEEHLRHLYTAVTRASKKLVLVLNSNYV